MACDDFTNVDSTVILILIYTYKKRELNTVHIIGVCLCV